MQAIGDGVTLSEVSLDDEAELARIDAFVLDHPEGQLFQRPAWLQAVADGCGQAGAFIVATNRGGGIEGVVPFTRVESRLFGRALVSSGFGVGGGILADPDVAPAIAGRVWASARQGGFMSAELRGGTPPGDGWCEEQSAHANFSRELAPDDAAQLLAIPRKQRAEIRRSFGFELEFQVGRTRRDRDAHHRVYSESVRNLGTPVFPRRLFDAALDRFGDDAEILTVRKNGEALASVLSFRFKGTTMPYWGGGTAAARAWRANDAMYFELMRRARELGCDRFDFGRSKVGSGAFAFKKNWGFEPEPLCYWTRGERREVSPNDARFQRKIELWKKLPLPVANVLGPMISRGLG